MRPSLPVLLAIGLSLTGTLPYSYADTAPKPLEPNAPRTITVFETATPPVVRVGLLQSTLILLPAEEKVANVFAGDTVNWVFDGGHVPSRFISIKPRLANAATDVHIISDHGNEYTLQLREVSSDGDAHFDAKVFLAPADKDAKERLASLPVFVPASELTKAQDATAAAEKAKTAELKTQAEKAEQFRSQYPNSLHFDYEWDKAKGKEMGVEEIWRDDKFTYIRGKFQETPALYEVKEKKPSLINFDFSNGLYTVPKELDSGYLEIGKQKVEFRRAEGDR